MENMRNGHRILFGILEGTKPLERPKCKKNDEISSKKIECEWTGFIWLRI
jgi:hypothetical protein